MLPSDGIASGRISTSRRPLVIYFGVFSTVACLCFAIIQSLTTYSAIVNGEITVVSPVGTEDTYRLAGETIWRRLQGNVMTPPPPQEVCSDEARWDQLLWAYLSYTEKEAWTVLNWTESSWDLAHPTETTSTTRTTTILRRLSADGFFSQYRRHTELPTQMFEVATASASQPQRRLQGAQSTTTTTVTTTMTTTTFVPDTETTCFGDLTEMQRDAVLKLGYTISSWHACKNPSCPWPAGIPEERAPCWDKWLYLENKYDSSVTSWADLTAFKRKALELLGWDEAGERWSSTDKPETYAKLWDSLSQTQIEAAMFLGYEKMTWNGCVAETPCLTRLELLQDRQRNWKWYTMEQNNLGGMKQRLGQLGWVETNWIEGEEPASYKVEWMNLNMALSVPATLIGFREDTWDGCPVDPCLERYEYVKRRYTGISWGNMKLAEQRAWQLLGHNEALWEQSGMSGTRLLQKRFEELTGEQQTQAKFLGHDLGTWQGCNMAWSDMKDNVTNGTEEVQDPFRTVRARMTIARSFAEISGNVYGNQVAQLPTSFMMIFNRAIARAIFCGNPPMSDDPKTYLNEQGEPLCILNADYERQRRRVFVVTVVEGSIIVDFVIVKNQSAKDPSAPYLFSVLQRQLEIPNSPICQDSEFGVFAKSAEVEEIPLDHLSPAEREAALEFEKKRGAYGDGNACSLHNDAKNGIIRCPVGGSQHQAAWPSMWLTALLATLLTLCNFRLCTT